MQCEICHVSKKATVKTAKKIFLASWNTNSLKTNLNIALNALGQNYYSNYLDIPKLLGYKSYLNL